MKVLSTNSGETERMFNAVFVASGVMAAILRTMISHFLRHEMIIVAKLTYYCPSQFPPPQQGVSAAH